MLCNLFSLIYSFISLVHHLINKNVLGKFGVVLKESSKQPDRMGDIVGTTSLTDTVHAQLRVTKVQSASTQGSREHRADGAAAARVVADNKQLQRDVLADLLGMLAGDFLQKDDTGRVGGVTGIGVDLNDRALVHFGLVIGLVFPSVIGVNGVSHISRDKE